MMEHFGTTYVMAKRPQVKFYADEDLTKDIAVVFKRQGVSLSEGMSRLMRFIIEAPDSMKPVILKQAPGDAVIALAMHTLAERAGKKNARFIRHATGLLGAVGNHAPHPKDDLPQQK
jgi:hypothetical protein